MSRRPRVAIAHDYLTQRGGAERVVLSLLRAFPDAAVHTTLYEPDETYPEFRDARIVTSPLNRHAMLRADHRRAFPLLRRTAERMRVEADVVVASTSGWAHGFDMVGKRLVYCHAPARWLYQAQEYLGGPVWASPKGWLLSAQRHALLRWDSDAADRADRYLCNSHVVQGRIAEDYAIDAAVVPPPFGINDDGVREPIPGALDWATTPEGGGGFLLVVARLMPYKNVDQVIEAVRGMPDRLVVIGHGPERQALERAAPGNVRFFSHLPDAQMHWAYDQSRLLVAPSFEDFGLTPLEAAAHGRPTVALRGGGYLDTVVEGKTGAFFDQPSVGAIQASLTGAIHREWDEVGIRRHADRFSEERFIDRIRDEVEALANARPRPARGAALPTARGTARPAGPTPTGARGTRPSTYVA